MTISPIIQADGSTSDSTTDDDGIIKVEDVIPYIVEIKVKFEEIESSYVVNFSTVESSDDEILLKPNENTLLASKPIDTSKKIIMIFYTEEFDVSE